MFGGTNSRVGSIEILVDPPPEVIQQSAVAAGMGVLYRYHPDSGQRLAEGFSHFGQTTTGRLVLARANKRLIIGYAVIAKPSPQERWSDPSAPEILELAIIEVARGWRQRGIGRQLLRACFADGAWDDRIVLAAAYSWHWDLQRTRLSKPRYREVLLKLFRSEGLLPVETDEPNIREDSANQLLVRIGARVTPEAVAGLRGLLQDNPGQAAVPPENLSASWRRFFDSLVASLQVWNPTWWLSRRSGISQAMLFPGLTPCSPRARPL